jgi:hypothetical protein
MRGRRRATLAGLLLLLSSGTVAGCGSGSDPSHPTGVDGLVIPTPSVDPDDFVTGVDNPWFPLPVGATWEYDVTGDLPGTATVTTDEGPEVAGVATTAVRTTLVPDHGDRSIAVDLYAQDDDGNVWWFGREGTWLAGEDGAEAGLVMAARPRVGDGYRQAFAPGVVDLRAEVVGIGDGEVVLEVSSPLTGSVQRSSYDEGVGLVSLETVEGAPEMQLGLAAYDEP